MVRYTVSRNDNLYECFPDIAQNPDGTLVCIYRECMGHGPYPFSRLVWRRSFDEGQNWTEREIITECVPRPEDVDKNRSWLEPDAILGYEQTAGRIREDWQVGSSINCARMQLLADGTLFLIADFAHHVEPGKRVWQNRIWRSRDGGETWLGPELAQLTEGLVPSVTQLRNGDILVGLATPDSGKERAFFARSSDNGHSWSEPVFLPFTDGYQIDEVDFIELDDNTIVGFGRNLALERAHRPSCGLKVISGDGGASWEGPYDTWLMGLEGRPKVGLLSGGEVCVTYRCDMPNELLAMHVMTQDAAKFTGTADLVERQPVVEDIPTKIAKETGQTRPWYMTSYYPGRTFVIDIDRSVHRDSGYSGWVLLENGDMYVVDYINDDAPLAHIRGYRISRSDYLLFPDGDLPWLHPSGQPFRGITLGLARDQREKNRRRP